MSTTAGRITKGGTKFVPKRKQQGPSAASARVASVNPSLAQATPRQVPQVDPSPLAHVEELALPPTPDDPLPLPPAPPSPSETFLAPAPPLPKPQPPPPPSNASGSSFGPSDPTASSSRPRQTTPPRAPSPPKSSSSASPHRLPNLSPRGRPAVPQGTAFNFGPSAPPPSRARAVSPPPTPPAAALPTPAPTAPPPAAKAKEKEKGKKAPVASTSNAAEREGDADEREDGVDEQAAKRDAVNARRRETAKAKKEGKKPAPPPAKAAGAGAKDKGKKRALDQDALEKGGEGGGGGGEASGSKAKKIKKAGAGGEKDVAGSSNDAMDVVANPSRDPDEDDDGEPRTQREIEGEAERDERDKAAKRDKANAKRRETARLKREKLAAAAAAEDREEGEDGPMLPPPPKRTRGPNKPKPKTTTSGGEEEEEEDPDALVPKKCKRRTKVGRAKPSKVDRMLFGSGASDDDDDGSVEPSNASGSDADEETGSDESDGSLEEGSDGEMRPKKKPSKKPKKGKGKGKGKGKVFRRKKSPERPIVDPAVTKMSDLATPRDTLGGRVSERGLELAKNVEMKKVARKEARARMRDRALRRKRGESVSDDENEGAGADDKASLASRHPSRRASPALSTMSSVRAGSPALLDAVAAAIGRGDLDLITDLGAKEKNDEDASDEDDYGDLVETQYAPQMRIVDGELVIDDASLEIDRSAQAQDGWSGPREVIEESAKDRMVNSATWGKQVRTEKWTSEETEAFYDYLSQFGTDFEMIAGLFPTRTRRQIKAKWNKEDRLNPKGITAALMRRKNIDLVSYAKVTGQDLSGPVPEDPFEKIQLLRQDIEAKALENGEPVFGHSGTGKLKKGGKLGKGGKKGKGKEREEEGGEGSDDDGGGLGSDVDAALAGLGDGEDEEEEEERRRLEEEAEAAAIDREIAEAEEAERLAAKRRKRA